MRMRKEKEIEKADFQLLQARVTELEKKTDRIMMYLEMLCDSIKNMQEAARLNSAAIKEMCENTIKSDLF